jgi:hypothetical protein
MQKWIKNKGKINLKKKVVYFNCFFRHVVTELLVTEQVYVEELRTVIEVNIYFLNRFFSNDFI